MQTTLVVWIVLIVVAGAATAIWLWKRPPEDGEPGGIAKLIRASQAGIDTRAAQAWIESSQRFKLARSVVVLSVAINASLAQAKDAMTAKAGCQDVIITKSGAPGDKIEGWLTNVDFEHYSRL